MASGILLAAGAAADKVVAKGQQIQAGSEPNASPRPVPGVVRAGAATMRAGTKLVSKAAGHVTPPTPSFSLCARTHLRLAALTFCKSGGHILGWPQRIAATTQVQASRGAFAYAQAIWPRAGTSAGANCSEAATAASFEYAAAVASSPLQIRSMTCTAP